MAQELSKRGKIVIADDTAANLKVLTHFLTQHGYEVRVAENGIAAVTLVARELPDLVLMDVMMPQMGGYEACQQLKANAVTRDIPVIFITFLKELDEKIKGFDVGGIDYITKPFQAQEVLARVDAHVANRKLQHHLQQESARLQALSDAAFEGILLHDQTTIVEANRALEDISGYPRAALLGQSPLILITPEWHLPVKQQIELANGQPAVVEGRCADGQTRTLEIRVQPIMWRDRDLFVSAIRDISPQLSLEQENLTLRATLSTQSQFGEMVGKSPAMHKVYEQLVRAAVADETVMIYGETGTGKELAARTIFAFSKHHTKEFVPVNCGAIQEPLFESQFFGYRKGAFTGADRDTPGYFDRAAGGTLFLDEVGELPITMQVKLLRVLEDRTYTPVGATTGRRADVRIIAATNQNLRHMLQAGKIREDFFHRLHVIALELPPLRHHKEDLSLLCEHFLRTHPTADGVVPTLPANILERFRAYDWPGNIRELYNELRRYGATGQVELHGRTLAVPGGSVQMSVLPGERPFNVVVAELEQQLLRRALAQTGGNKVKAAELLQLPLRTLHRKIKDYQM
jgi:PAS domain S-box-containing protein